MKRNSALLILILLLTGCTFVRTTTIKAKAKDINGVKYKGSGDAYIQTKTDVNIMYYPKECLLYY